MKPKKRVALCSSSPYLLFISCPLLLFTLFFAACTAPVTTPLPTTASPLPFFTASPTYTQTPTPSATPTLTARPTRRPTVTIAPTRTPVLTATNVPVNWLVGWSVAELEFFGFAFEPWINGNTLSIQQDEQEYWVNILDGEATDPFPRPIQTPVFANPSSFSESMNFAAECSDTQLILYKVPDKQIIGQIDETVSNCSIIRWKSDGMAFTFTTIQGKVYLWETLSSSPREIGSGLTWTPAIWSPDGTKILVLEPYQDSADEVTFNIIFVDGSPELKTGAELPAGNNWYPDYVHWVSDGLVGNYVWGAFYQYYWYYNAFTGEKIIEYGIESFPDGSSDNQQALVSPNRQWLILDHLIALPDEVYSEYFLLNTLTKDISNILSAKETHLAFVGWSENSSLFYAIARSVNETTQPNLSFPSGFLAFNPNTQEFTSIIPSAMYATLNPQKNLAFTLLPTDGQLTAAFYMLTGDVLATFHPVTDNIPYLAPGEGLPIPAAWSNDGTQIVFSDVWGDLWLADVSGNLTQLADKLGFDPAYPRQPRFSWSPDDSHLLITFNYRAWVVTLP